MKTLNACIWGMNLFCIVLGGRAITFDAGINYILAIFLGLCFGFSLLHFIFAIRNWRS